MKIRSLAIAIAILLFAAPAVFAQTTVIANPSQSHLLTPQQALNMRRISDLRFSPDGARLAFTVAEPPKDTENPHHIWIFDMAMQQTRGSRMQAGRKIFGKIDAPRAFRRMPSPHP